MLDSNSIFKKIVINDDCIEVMSELPENYVDAIVTDPPYALSFMSKNWDTLGEGKEIQEFNYRWAKEAIRVLKPGGHMLVAGIGRTHHRMMGGIEDAGFVVRDVLMHVFSTGFSKGLNVSKAITAQESLGTSQPQSLRKVRMGEDYSPTGQVDYKKGRAFESLPSDNHKTELTENAKQWRGWNTTLKPAWEVWVLFRKPLSEKNVALNVLKWGVGGLNIDGCRIGPNIQHQPGGLHRGSGDTVGSFTGTTNFEQEPHGRWPANFILSCDCEGGEHTPDCPVRILDEQSGKSKSGKNKKTKGKGGIWKPSTGLPCGPEYGDFGGASRFFYVGKPSKSEREAGLEDFPIRLAGGMSGRQDGSLEGEIVKRKNYHPTIKSIKLMRYLCRLVTPPDGLILDPFCGSGSTGCAAMLEGFRFIGVDKDEGYCKIARARIKYWEKTV